jgi:VanZ family protein
LSRYALIGCAVSLALAAIVTGLLLMPALPGKPFPVPFFDKFVHAAMFFSVALPAMLGLGPRLSWAVFAVVVAYSGLTELLQPGFGRSAEWSDFGANAVGAALAVPAARWLRLKVAKVKQRHRAKAYD